MPGGSHHFCLEVSEACPVEATIYGYYPNLAVNAFFCAIFGVCAIAQIVCGMRFKTWTYLIAMFFGCLAQVLGYIGRIMLHNNPWSDIGFQIQICCLIIAPAFNTAAIYLVLKHIVLCFGREFSKIRPKWYTSIFIAGDLLSLVLQGAGGGIAATADTDKTQDVGTNLMIAGIVWQVITLAIFAGAAVWYTLRRRRGGPLSLEAQGYVKNTMFRLFVLGFIVAFIVILVRCIYRIVEMSGGWRSGIMRDENSFIVLDGLMVLIATLCQTVFHPGYCFPRLANGYVAKESPAELKDISHGQQRA